MFLCAMIFLPQKKTVYVSLCSVNQYTTMSRHIHTANANTTSPHLLPTNSYSLWEIVVPLRLVLLRHPHRFPAPRLRRNQSLIRPTTLHTHNTIRSVRRHQTGRIEELPRLILTQVGRKQTVLFKTRDYSIFYCSRHDPSNDVITYEGLKTHSPQRECGF